MVVAMSFINTIAMQPHYVPRTQLLEALLQHRGTPDVKIITGVRRCGKSTLMAMLADHLYNEGTPHSNVFYQRFDSFDIPLRYTADDLDRQLGKAFESADSHHPFTVMLDEIQDVPEWEKVVRRLQTRADTDVYITGSNATLLSGEFATLLTGRHVSIEIYPLSFNEYRDFISQIGTSETNPQQTLADYMLYGGMPGQFALRTRNADTCSDELQGIYESIVFKDVAQRYDIRDITALEKLSQFLFSTSGTLFSARNVVNTLNSDGQEISITAVNNYIAALERAFLIYSAHQQNIRGKALLRPLKKYYPVDVGFRNLANGFSGTDIGARLECVVFMELRRRGYSVQVGTDSNEEIDFVATRKGHQLSGKSYIQVTASMLESSTRQRELAPLLRLSNAFPRIVITLDPYSAGVTEEGIRIINATDWLLDKA